MRNDPFSSAASLKVVYSATVDAIDYKKSPDALLYPPIYPWSGISGAYWNGYEPGPQVPHGLSMASMTGGLGQNIPFNNDDHLTIGTDNTVEMPAEAALRQNMP
jgi:hypothetical protein